MLKNLLGYMGQSRPYYEFDNYIILDIGQSNSAGRAEAGRLPEQEYTRVPANVKTYFKSEYTSADNGSWQAMNCGANTTDIYPSDNTVKDLFNADLSIGVNLVNLINKNIYIINGGAGGTTLEQNINANYDWNAASTDELLDRFLLYYFDVGVGKLTGTKKVLGVTWHQGETDCTDNTATANYESNMTALIAKVRAHDSLLTSVPFFLTKLDYWSSGDGQDFTNQGLINIALQNIADSDANSYFIDIDDQPRKEQLTTEQKKGVTPSANDDKHTSYLGQIAKGERIFEQIKTINGWN